MLVSLIINLVYSFQEAVRFLHVGSLRLVSLIINLVYSFQEAVRFLHVGSLSNKNTYEKASQFQIGTGWPFSLRKEIYI